MRFNELSLLGEPVGEMKLFDFEREPPKSLLVISTPEDGVRNIGFGNLTPDNWFS